MGEQKGKGEGRGRRVKKEHVSIGQREKELGGERSHLCSVLRHSGKTQEGHVVS